MASQNRGQSGELRVNGEHRQNLGVRAGKSVGKMSYVPINRLTGNGRTGAVTNVNHAGSTSGGKNQTPGERQALNPVTWEQLQ